MREKIVSQNERKFAVDCIASGYRLDSRDLDESREVTVKLGPSWGFAEVKFGGTHAIATTTVDAVTPSTDRPSEGNLSVFLDVSPASSEGAARESLAQQRQQQLMEIKHAIDGFVRDSRCVDTEALCIVSGRRVWAVRVAIDVVHDEGNCLDCAMMAAMASLLHARRPDVAVTGHDVRIFSMDEREPVPLPVHHIPLAVSFVIVDHRPDGSPASNVEIPVIDPTKVEEAATNGVTSFAFNSQGEICGVYKAGGIPLLPKTFAKCATIAAKRVLDLTNVLKVAMKEAAEEHPMSTMRPMLVHAEPTAVIRTEILEVRDGDDDDDDDASSDAAKQRKDVTMSSWNAMKMPDEAPPPPTSTKKARGGSGIPVDVPIDEQVIEDSLQSTFGKTGKVRKSSKRDQGKHEDEDINMQEDRRGDRTISIEPEPLGNQGMDDDDDEDDDSSDDDLAGAVLSKKKRK